MAQQNLAIISLGNGLPIVQHQAITWTNADSLSTGPLGRNTSEMLTKNTNIFAQEHALTHWGGVTHICVNKLTIIGSDNGLSPDRCQAIIWTNAGILSIGPLGTKLSEILIAIHIFSFKKMHLKMSSALQHPFQFGLNELNMLFTKSQQFWSSIDVWKQDLTVLYQVLLIYKDIYNGKSSKTFHLVIREDYLGHYVMQNIFYVGNDMMHWWGTHSSYTFMFIH